MEEQAEYQIDIKQIAVLLLKKAPFIIALTLIFGVAAFIYSNYFITPMYQATVTFWVDNQQGVSESAKVQGTDFSTAAMLAKGYVSLIDSDMVLDEVAVISGLNYTSAQLKSMISAGMLDEETPTFGVMVINPVPENAQKIANVIGDVAPSQIQSIIKGSNATIVDPAKLPTAPISPNVKRNTFVGLALGLILGAGLVILINALDVRIKSSDYLTQKYGLPVLGMIPRIETASAKAVKTAAGEKQ